MPINSRTWPAAVLAIFGIFVLNEYYPKAARGLLFLIFIVLLMDHTKELQNMLTGR